MWALSLKVWHDYQINHVYIFEFDPQKNLKYWEVMEEAANVSLVAKQRASGGAGWCGVGVMLMGGDASGVGLQ